MKKRAFIFILIFFLVPLAFAQVSSIRMDKIGSSEATISPLGEAVFDVTFTNEKLTDDVVFLEVSDVRWSISATNAYEYTTGIALGPQESHTTKIYMKPATGIEPGTYFVELRARSQNTKEYASQIFVIKVDPKVMDYSVEVPVEVLEPVSIDPSRTNSIKVLFKNPYPVYLINLSIDANSKFLNKNTEVDIPPNSDKIVDFSLSIDSSTPKQEDTLKITVKQNGKQVGSAEKTIFIKEYRLPYKVDVISSKHFLYTEHDITFTNTEGALKKLDASIQKPSTYAILRTAPGAKTEEFDGVQYLVWEGVSLNPNETYKVQVIEDYRPVAGAGIILLLIIIAYYSLRSPIIVKKKAYAIHKKDTGNNELKIVLYIMNRTGRTLEKVRVLDRLPIIHRVEEDFGPGTPEPKYRKSHDGIILDWDIALAPREERIFTYKVKSSLPLVGEFTLKPCIVQYGSKGRRTSSGEYRLVID